MTHEEIKNAIERLRAGRDDMWTADIVDALIGEGVTSGRTAKFIDALIDALEQADPDTHIELPVDADGEVIHIGDKVESDTSDDGTVFGIEYFEGDCVRIAVRPHNWDTPTWCDPKEYRHRHAPTVEDVLRGFAGEWFIAMGDSGCESKILGKYAEKLREVMQND